MNAKMNMNKITQLLTLVLTLGVLGVGPLGVTAPAAAGEKVEFRLKDGSRFRGEVGDTVRVTYNERRVTRTLEGELIEAGELYLIVRGTLAGRMTKKTLFIADIQAIEAIQSGGSSSDNGADSNDDAAGSGRPSSKSSARKADTKGVFYMPLEGTVGIKLRHEEIERLVDHADSYGPGQIIVFMVNSPGGLVLEMEPIRDAIVEGKKRHRIIMWIKKAISGGCGTALPADEIYFMSEGTAGAMTAFAGGQSWQGEHLQIWLQEAGKLAEIGGRDPIIAHAMIHAPVLLSYDKDPETGEVTWHNDLSGEYVLSGPDENLVFTSSTAVHSGFADGVADTKEQLAHLLDLPRWKTVDDYGKRIAKKWHQTVDRAQEEIPKLAARLQFKGAGDPPPRRLGIQIQIYEKLIDWWGRCPNVARMHLPPVDQLERIVQELRHQLSQMRNR